MTLYPVQYAYKFVAKYHMQEQHDFCVVIMVFDMKCRVDHHGNYYSVKLGKGVISDGGSYSDQITCYC